MVHHKWSYNTGHYTSYIKDHNQKQWFNVNDDKVRGKQNYKYIVTTPTAYVTKVKLSTVLKQDPFLLVYELCSELFILHIIILIMIFRSKGSHFVVNAMSSSFTQSVVVR